LAEAGCEAVFSDNLSNSNLSVPDRLESFTSKCLSFIEGDVRDTIKLQESVKAHQIDAVIYLVGLKAVGESADKPIEYCDNNIVGMVSLLKAKRAADVKTLVFCISAAVYGDPQYVPLDEMHPASATNPYGRSSPHVEEMFADVANSDVSRCIACLRYFNPVGPHDSGLIAEDLYDIPNNLTPYFTQVASGKLPELNVFGG